MELDTCYNCHKQGHWARDCPEKAKITTTEPCIAPEFPTKQCPCGVGPCVVRTSRTEKNPNRKFYSCPADPPRRCNFFAWCDTVTDDDQRFRMPKSPYPVCSCGAGKCNLLTVKNGKNVGRRFFVCPVKKGQGACNFFQWEDDVGKTVDKGNLDKENIVISHKPIVERHGDTRTEDCDTGKSSDHNEVEGPPPPVSEERDTDTGLATENLVEEENAGLVSGANDTHLPPIQSLRLNEGGRFETSPKPGKSGHSMKGCSVL